jgi:predicted ATPase
VSQTCECEEPTHECRLVVLTGGPGAGKTSVLELIKKSFCPHVAVLPEAAGIVFGGGFPRRSDLPARRAGQRAIYRIQRELERLAQEEHRAAVVLCDRGTLDGLAYWPDAPSAFWKDIGVSRDEELARYAAVIHLRTPSAAGYNRVNPLRVENADEAAAIDARIADAWRDHPRRAFVENRGEFLHKAAQALALVRAEVPACCRGHVVPGIDDRSGAGP